MFVLGVDPGLSRCGYCCVSAGPGRAAGGIGRGVPRSAAGGEVVAAGYLTTPVGEPVPQRLAALQQDIRSLLAELQPEVVALERVLFQVNVRTAMGVGQAAGVVMAESIAAGCDVVEYSPNQVKLAVSGDGAADKAQVARMVQMLLGLAEPLRPADVSDAAAVALCHLAQPRIPATAIPATARMATATTTAAARPAVATR